MNIYRVQEGVNKLINKINSRRIYYLRKGEIGINLGSDIETIPSFVGIDGSFLIFMMKSFLPKFVKKSFYKKTWANKNYSFEDYFKKVKSIRIIHFDLSYGIPFKKESLQFIFTSHFLEHLAEETARILLKDCFRVLKKGGIMRIIVPDFDEEIKLIVDKIKKYKKNNSTAELQEYLTVPKHHSEFGFHKRIYNFKELKSILEKSGFRKIVRRKLHQGKLPELKKLDLKKGLIIEAEK
ncbi:MAG: methyltransferase domain-containing protein [Candidatus Pacearchaeota archaeon]